MKGYRKNAAWSFIRIMIILCLFVLFPASRIHAQCGACPKLIQEPCETFTENRANCKIVNPADLIESTCRQFADKLQACEAYTCQAPYVLNPTVKAKWQIHGKNKDRCIVSNTVEDIGIKNDDNIPKPMTQMCEYDSIGIKGLIQQFADFDNRYYHFSTCKHFEGIYNCTFKLGGLPLP